VQGARFLGQSNNGNRILALVAAPNTVHRLRPVKSATANDHADIKVFVDHRFAGDFSAPTDARLSTE